MGDSAAAAHDTPDMGLELLNRLGREPIPAGHESHRVVLLDDLIGFRHDLVGDYLAVQFLAFHLQVLLQQVVVGAPEEGQAGALRLGNARALKLWLGVGHADLYI